MENFKIKYYRLLEDWADLKSDYKDTVEALKETEQILNDYEEAFYFNEFSEKDNE